MTQTHKNGVDAEKIAELAELGRDVSAHFTNRFTVVRPAVQSVYEDLAAAMLKEPSTASDGVGNDE